MSHPNKIALLRRARKAGFRSYLYYVSTEAPEINIERVRIRVEEGGHDVARAKVAQRYPKSLANLLDAIAASDGAYIFDNSGKDSYLTASLKSKIQTFPFGFRKMC